ncbi:MAG: hypothetical protein AMXMBFR47_39730 [Planctomycetota bacterium]
MKSALSLNTTAVVAIAITLLAHGSAVAQDYGLSWYSIDSGGGSSTGGAFVLEGTIGQFDAGSMSGGSYELVGGFWAGASASTPLPCPGDTNGDRRVDLSDLSVLLGHFGTPSGATLADGDIDADGDVDLSDLTSLLGNFGLNCD